MKLQVPSRKARFMTWNVRSICSEGKRVEVAHALKSIKGITPIICIQETRLKQVAEGVKYGRFWLYSTPSSNGVGGVGFFAPALVSQ